MSQHPFQKVPAPTLPRLGALTNKTCTRFLLVWAGPKGFESGIPSSARTNPRDARALMDMAVLSCGDLSWPWAEPDPTHHGQAQHPGSRAGLLEGSGVGGWQ